ncbi:unnamed protein product [Colias eurytheme]|nr:unnamed protein product [Colias eurytheme]
MSGARSHEPRDAPRHRSQPHPQKLNRGRGRIEQENQTVKLIHRTVAKACEQGFCRAGKTDKLMLIVLYL